MNGEKQYRGYTFVLRDNGRINVNDPKGNRAGYTYSDARAKAMVDEWVKADEDGGFVL